MINFTNKFELKSNNIAFFIPEKLEFKNNSKLSSSNYIKISSFLNKTGNANEKKIISFDLSENQRCFFIVVKKSIFIHEINSLGANFKLTINSDKSIKKANIFCKLNFKIENFTEENFIHEFCYGYELKSYSFEKYITKKKNNIQLL